MRIAVTLMLLSTAVFAAEPNVKKYALITTAGRIGTLTVERRGSIVDNTWTVDDNGRGSKLKEHVELGKDGLPTMWTVEGKAWVGSPVSDSFSIKDGKAVWKTLDEAGEAAPGLYYPPNATPWANVLMLERGLAAKDATLKVLPGGTFRFEKVRDIVVGDARKGEKATVYAMYGYDFAPQLMLRSAKGELLAMLAPGWVLIDEKHQAAFSQLSELASSLSIELLKTISTKVSHRIEKPLWLTNVRIFDSATGKVGQPTNVVVFNDTIVSIRSDAPPAGSLVVDGNGGTLLPGLCDAHFHTTDWGGLLNLASGVTFTRDPGNDNEVLLGLESRIKTGELVGTTIVKSGFLEGKSPYSAHLGFIIDSEAEALEKVRWYADHGYWGIKIYNSMNPALVAPIAKEAHRLGLHVSGHIPAFMTSERAVRDGYDEITHINQLLLSFVITEKEDTRTPFRFTALGERVGTLDLKKEPFQNMLKLMKEKKTAFDPTIGVFAGLLQSRAGKASEVDEHWLSHAPISIQRVRRSAALDVKPESDPLYAASWKKLKEALALLHREGIVMVPGTDDSASGVSLHSELELWVEAGIPASAALSMATLGSAKYFGLDGSLGSIAQGKRADLYLVDGDPTKDISVLRKGKLVVRGGAYYYPDEIDAAVGLQPFSEHSEMKAH